MITAVIIATILLGLLACFQIALIFKAPLGHFAWGGKHRTLPAKLRVSSAVSLVIYAGFAAVLLSKSGAWNILPDTLPLGILTWIIFSYLALGVIMNAASRTKPERYTMTPVALTLAICAFIIASGQAPTTASPASDTNTVRVAETTNSEDPPAVPTEVYKGNDALVANTFSVKVPGGWSASISKSSAFLAIMFARPNQLGSLTYSANSAPIVDENGIPSWGGLTEHFFILSPTASSRFNPADHLEVSSEPFTFDDGTLGQKYYVVKKAAEAKKWGGLQKDTEWQGRTYIYEKGAKRIEAHLAQYPSTSIDIPFYESVVKSLKAQP